MDADGPWRHVPLRDYRKGLPRRRAGELPLSKGPGDRGQAAKTGPYGCGGMGENEEKKGI